MADNILITGGSGKSIVCSSIRHLSSPSSGYLGGTLLARLGSADLPLYGKLYALVRTAEQAEAVKQYGAEPLTFDPYDEVSVLRNVTGKKITIVYHLIDAARADSQLYFLKALAEVKRITEREVHFLHTSGAKIFSSHAGAPTDCELRDDDPELYNIQTSQKAPLPLMQGAVNTNNQIMDKATELGVRSYIFVPCIVYGKGEGFGNRISIQTVAIVQAAKGVRQVYRTDTDRPSWPVCHVSDNTALYIELLRHILTGKNPDHGKNGYYLASSGNVAWDDLYSAMAAALFGRGIIEDESVKTADEAALKKMGEALGCPPQLVPVQLGGK